MSFFDFIRRPRIKYDPLIKVLISKDKLLENFRTYKKNCSHYDFAPVLKSNAYGHGLIEVATILDPEKPVFFVVDSFYEALALRRGIIKSKILIIGYTREQLMVRKNLKNISFTIASIDSLRGTAKLLRYPTLVHLKIDTGMHRQGIAVSEINTAIELIKSNHNIVLEGLCSHLSDPVNKSFTDEQVGKWNEAVAVFRKKFSDLRYFHLSATEGVNIKADANVARLGLGLYDSTLEIRSILSSIKEIKTGDKVGYGLTFEATRPMKIATVPAGYNEGVDLRLSNKGTFFVRGEPCPIIGRVSMNITTVDVSRIFDANLGDEVVIIGNNRSLSNSAPNIAETCDTIPYEILTHIPVYLRRQIV